MKPLPKKFFIRVPAPEINEIVQKKLFELNYCWATDFVSTEYKVEYTEYPIILSGSWVEYYDGPNKFRVLEEGSGGVKDIEEYLDKLTDYQEISITDLFNASPFNKTETFSDYYGEYGRLMDRYSELMYQLHGNHITNDEKNRLRLSDARQEMSSFVSTLIEKVINKK